MTLSVLCVTRGDKRALPFLKRMEELSIRCGAELLVAVDRQDNIQAVQSTLRALSTRIVFAHSRGYVESALDLAVVECTGDYILRLDDDESVSIGLADWLIHHEYESREHWCFPRAWLWPDAYHFLTARPHWPDFQTRLSVARMAGGRCRPHEGSPYGSGEACLAGAIEHHKLLLWSAEERIAQVEEYERLQPGCRPGIINFYLPPAKSPVSEWPV